MVARGGERGERRGATRERGKRRVERKQRCGERWRTGCRAAFRSICFTYLAGETRTSLISRRLFDPVSGPVPIPSRFRLDSVPVPSRFRPDSVPVASQSGPDPVQTDPIPVLPPIPIHRACSSALNRIRLRVIFLHRAIQRLYRNRLTLHQPPLVEENLNRSPSRLGPVDGSCGAANTNFCKQLLGYSRFSAAEELRGRESSSFLTKK